MASSELSTLEQCEACEPEEQQSGSSSQEAEAAQRLQRIAAAYSTILHCIGEEPTRPGLLDTPMRAAKAMVAATAGYAQDPRDIAGGALFGVDLGGPSPSTAPLGMVFIRDIKVNSLCEHHLLPFFGVAHVAYMPGSAVLGLSKLARIADALARRLQMQERLTEQLADAMMEVAQARGVAVVVECSHMCMCSRGVKQAGALTLTSAARGVLATDVELKREFYALLALPPVAAAAPLAPSSRL